MSDHYKSLVAVSVILIKDKKVLLLRRANAGWRDGEYNLPSGHLEDNESIIEAAVRETKEECDITVKPMDLHLVHVSHRKTNHAYVDLYFRAYAWHGEPRLTEEDKSDEILWAELDNLPDNTVDFVKEALKQIEDHEIYSQFGWKND